MTRLKQTGWTGFPSGYEKCVMELAVPRSEVESRYRLVFMQGEDKFEYSTYFNDDVLGPVTILYDEKPERTKGRAYVMVDWNVKYKVAVPRLLEVFGLDSSLVATPDDLDGADAQHELSSLQQHLKKNS